MDSASDGAVRRSILPVIAGSALLLLAVVPFHASLRAPDTGLAGTATADMASAAAAMTWTGLLFALAVALVCSRALAPARVDDFVAATRRRVLMSNARTFAFAVAVVGACLALLVEFFTFHDQPVLIDAIAQLTHARYLAAGLAHAPADTIGFFRLQQSAPVTGGWISQYPPVHVVVLAIGEAMHAVWVVGPVMFGTALFFTARAVDMLLPDRAAARLGISLAAMSPFMLAHAATFMSHTTAAACIAIALYSFARSGVPGAFIASADESPRTRWLIACGLAIGAAFATRPMTGLTVGLAFAAVTAFRSRLPAVTRARSISMIAIGALPFIAAVAAYNVHYFGAPTRFGYDVALGPNAGLGFGIDPWGNSYGLRQAIAYTSAEMAVLSLQLFETPIPLVALIAIYLMLSRTMRANESVIAVLALAPVVTHLAYWHHGLFMGPRMLNEYGIIWAVLAALAIAAVYERLPAYTPLMRAYSPRLFMGGIVAAAFAGMLVLAPQRILSYAAPPSHAYAAAASAGAGIVFVHGGWGERASMQLASRGWRLDEVESALRQNSTCAVQRVIDGTAPRTSLDLAPRATNLPKRVEFPAGNPIRMTDGDTWTDSCARQVASDSAGVIDPSTLLWRGALPGLQRGSMQPTFARDLGPQLNQALAPDDARDHVLLRSASGEPTLVSYSEGMRRLWKVTAQ